MIDRVYYQHTYRGSAIPPESFDHYEQRAALYIQYITNNRVDEDAAPDGVKYAVCAIMDLMYQGDAKRGIASENNDGYSVSYRTGAYSNRELYRAAKRYIPADLLYRGVYHAD